MGRRESDSVIVLRGGRTDHTPSRSYGDAGMGKRSAGWSPGQKTDAGENDCLASKLAFDAVFRTLSKSLLRDHPEEPPPSAFTLWRTGSAVEPLAGICERATR